MQSRKTSVLVVDDDARMLRMMQQILELENYRVLRAHDGESAINAFDEETPALVLLDIMMPDIDGYTVCQRIREFSQVPIIMVTAKNDDMEKIEGLDAGADDYITKPFSSGELAARVRAALRRATFMHECYESIFSCRNLIVDFVRQRVALNGDELYLTATEYRLLCCLAQNAGRVLTPEQILERVWGDCYLDATHMVQVYIARLRKKLRDDARNPRYIITRSGIGYMMVKEI